MTINEIIIGHRVLLQRGESVKEVAQIKGITDDNNAIVRLSNGELAEINPEYILKDFGA